jgi:hypothetical protein
MKPWIKTSLMAALAAGFFSGPALAACGDGYGPGGCGGFGPGGGGRGGGWNLSAEQIKERLNKRMEVQLARLELALALTPEQKSAWADFKKAAQSRVDNMAQIMENRRKAGPPETAAQWLERAEEANKLHARTLADTRKAVDAFYGKLGAAQKTVFDAEFSQFASRRGGMGRGGMGMGMGPMCGGEGRGK